MSGSLTSSLTSTNHQREFQARAGAVTVHTTLIAVTHYGSVTIVLMLVVML
jgi:hypothetical protein